MSGQGAGAPSPNRADELRRRVVARNVDAILDAAIALLEHNPKPSLVEIAKTAGVSRPTLYAHFPTREDLVEAAAKRSLAEAQREVHAADVDNGSASTALKRLVTAGWRSLARNLTIARLALDVLPPERLRALHEDALDPFRRLITRGQRTGEFRHDQPPEWMVAVLYSLLHTAADEVISGHVEEELAAELVYESALGALRPTAPDARRPPDSS